MQVDLTDKFRKFILTNELFDTKDNILLAVSGGLDSMVMTHLFHNCAFPFSIAHCNFSMRGDESDADEEMVRSLAKKFGADFYSKKFDTIAYATEKKYSVQQAARELRYEWFDSLCQSENFNKVVTAHHHNDSIETFFINLLRGTGPAGLTGIPLVNNKIVRPLLFATREEISSYAKQKNILFRTDASNETDDYLRNRIRHHLMPVIGSLSSDYEKKFMETFRNMSFMVNYANECMNDWKESFCVPIDGMIHFPIELINAQENPAAFLEFLLYSYKITGIECEKILNAKSPGKVFSGGEYDVLRDREFIILKKHSTAQLQVPVREVPFMMTFGEKFIRLNYTGLREFRDGSSYQQIDATKLTFPLTLRTWNSGDYFYPLGMTRRKKVSDFFIDNKLSLFDKENALLLLSGNDIVCILGHRIDDRYKITESTEKILSIELS
jgi:tRNA(Ile)-lysidine synthase